MLISHYLNWTLPNTAHKKRYRYKQSRENALTPIVNTALTSSYRYISGWGELLLLLAKSRMEEHIPEFRQDTYSLSVEFDRQILFVYQGVKLLVLVTNISFESGIRLEPNSKNH